MNIWKKLNKNALSRAGEFLREREETCVSAISRFNAGITSHAWAVCKPGGGSSSISALLLYGKGLLFPVFHFSFGQNAQFKTAGLPLPFFLPMIFRNEPLHAAQGLADDMDMLEKALEKKEGFSSSKYEYELRRLDYRERDFTVHFPAGLVIRRAETADIGKLFPLQAAYETEEVLPRGAVFNPASCRKTLETLVSEKTILAAELDGVLVGKININAMSFNCFQIGGVYVLPEYRRRGIARSMTAALIRKFAPQKKCFTLFVKKANIPARKVYDSLGFIITGDYRISYFG